MNNYKKLYLQIKKDLQGSTDAKYKKTMEGFIVGGKARKYGVRVPVLKKIVAGITKDLQNVDDWEFLDFIEELYKGGSFEEMHLVCYLLSKRKSVLELIKWPLLKKWSESVDNWAINDNLSCLVIGPWVLLDFEGRVKYLERLIVSKNLWDKRLALVSIIIPNRHGLGWEKTLEFVEIVVKERNPMIVKAVSWVLREMVRKGAASEVKTFLERNKTVLAPLVVREVNNKITTGLKNPKKS